VLFLLPAVVALELQRRDHRLDIATVTVSVAAAVGWCSWRARRRWAAGESGLVANIVRIW
jgi:hypothetical protein